MKAIITKYLGPTNTRGSRIKASDGDRNSITVGYRSELNSDENHIEAAKALINKLAWGGEYVTGWIGNDAVHVPVQLRWKAKGRAK